MKKILIIILLAAVNFSFAQMLPDNFKITPEVLKNFKPATGNKRPNTFLGRFTAAPVSSQTIISNFISDIIVVNNSGGDTVWFGTGKGVSRTTNRGLSFENYYGTAPFGEDDVSGVAVYKNWVVVATAYSQKIDDDYIPTGTGIKVSSDYGISWSSYSQPKDALDDDTIHYGISTLFALPIVVDENNLSYDIAITKKNNSSDSLAFWITSWAGEFRKSTDYGASWQRVVLPPDAFNTITPSGGPYTFELDPNDPPNGNNNHKCFAVAVENDSTIYVGTAGGINRSSDWGISWKKSNYDSTGTGTGVSGDFVVGLEVQKFGNRTVVWASSNPAGTGQFSAFSYTSDGGLTWGNTLDDALFTHNVGFKDSIVYAATDNGVWRSYFTPPNFSWSKPSIIYDETIKDKIHTNLFYSVESQGDSVWVGSGDGLARTTDTLTSPWVGKWKIFRAFQPVNATNESYAAPNQFSPDDEVCRIFFKTGKTSSSVTVKLFDFAMFPVRTVVQNAQRNTPDVLWVIWDGKRDDGSQVANGVYFYRIVIDKEETVWGKIIVLQ